MKLLICLVLVALVGLSLGRVALPSDQIHTAPLPGSIGLSGTVADSAKAIDATNPEFGLRTDWEIPNVGPLVSGRFTEEQEDNVGVPTAITNFSNQTPAIPANVYNETGNVTGNVTITNETMVWY